MIDRHHFSNDGISMENHLARPHSLLSLNYYSDDVLWNLDKGVISSCLSDETLEWERGRYQCQNNFLSLSSSFKGILKTPSPPHSIHPSSLSLVFSGENSISITFLLITSAEFFELSCRQKVVNIFHQVLPSQFLTGSFSFFPLTLSLYIFRCPPFIEDRHPRHSAVWNWKWGSAMKNQQVCCQGPKDVLPRGVWL